MGYISSFCGPQGPEFIRGFLAAMKIYAVWNHGKECIGSPEKQLKQAQKEAIIELGDDPAEYEDEI